MNTLRGHPIYFDGDEWRYVDDDSPTSNTYRNCGICKLPNRSDGHDACIGVLQNVTNACCGHGDVKSAYVQFDYGYTIRGLKAIGYINAVKG